MILVDSNVIVDIFGRDPVWEEWSARQIDFWGSREMLAVNPLIYAELAIGYKKIEDLDADLSEAGFQKLELPYAAAFLAGKIFLKYRRRGGIKRAPLPDFYIGAHAQVANFSLLTRDVARYRTYFPKMKLIAPK